MSSSSSSCCCRLTGCFLSLVGLIALVSKLFQPLLRVFCSFAYPRYALPKRFGSWAIITGATDGIGEAMALKLASKGLNLLLISRSDERLTLTKQKIQQQIKIQTTEIEIETLQFDFAFQSASWSSANLQKLKDLIDSRDVGILVNNVGLSYPSALKFDELPTGLIDDLISVNIRSTFHLTQMVLPGMRSRRRGAVVCIGSGSSEVSTDPLYCGYASVKAAVECFCRSLQSECIVDNIIVQCQTPLLVITKLSKVKTASWNVPTAESYAHSAVEAIENSYASRWISSTVCPNIVHCLILHVIKLSPLGLWDSLRYKATSAIRKRYLAKSKAE